MSRRSGLQFSVARVSRQLKRGSYSPGGRVSKMASVYLTAVLEYLVAEIAELSGNAAFGAGKKRITPRHVMLAVALDDELHQ